MLTVLKGFDYMHARSIKLLLVALIVSGFVVAPVGLQETALAAGTTYYVDCVNGNDRANGTSTGKAWKTLERANKAKLVAGDSLLLKRGCTWKGPLQAKWNGTASNPITIGAYGEGAKPVIKNAPDGNVKISGSHQRIAEIKSVFELSAYASINKACYNQPQSPAWRVGFNFVGGHHNTLRDSIATGGSLGVNFTNSSHHNKFIHNRVVGNHGAWNIDSKWPQGGTAVFLHGDSNEVAHNHFEDNYTYCWDESISIELFDATNSKVHHNTSVGDKVFVEAGSGKLQSSNNVFAYNVHTTDVARARFLVTRGAGQSHGPVWNTKLYNNTIYYTGADSQGIACMACGPNVLTMRNNIIVAQGKAVYSGGGTPNESHNIFWKTDGGSLPHDFMQGFTPNGNTLVANPKFVDPGKGNFHLNPKSPAINRGSNDVLDAGFKADMDGDPVPMGGKVDIGADEVEISSPSESELQDPATQPIVLPARIEAENYKPGGQGVGYYDTTPGNTGGACRNDDVDLAETSDNGGGCNLGFVAAGEWLAYDILVPATGKYNFTARVATIHTGRTLHIEVDGKNVTGAMTAPNTGDWQTWGNVTVTDVHLEAGIHEMRIVMDGGNVNLNYVDVDAVGGVTNAIALPGRIEVEAFKEGGQGVGYFDTTPGNSGGACRDSDVDLAETQDVGGGCNLGYTVAGEWLAYDIVVPAAGLYNFTARVATPASGRSLHLEIDGQDITGPIAVPNTGGWQKWANVTTPSVELPAGVHELRIVLDSGNFNLNYIDAHLAGAGALSAESLAAEPLADSAPLAEATPAPETSPTPEASETVEEQQAPAVTVVAPAELTATLTDAGVELAWAGGEGVLHYVIERSTDGGEWNVLADDVPADEPRYTDDELEPGLTYSYRVKAVSEAGESEYSDVLTVTMPAATS